LSDPVLHVEREGPVAVLTLSRPKQMNALSTELRLALGSAFRELGGDASVRVAILTGAGKAFCAGMDLKELSGAAGGATGYDNSVVGQQEMREAIEAFSGPILAAVNGPAATAGFELALACDLIVASTRAVFIDSHARVGMLPGWGLSQRLPRLVGAARAKEVSLTGNALDAARAYEWGLVNRVVEPEELLPCCRALARDMASCVPDVMRGIKRLIDVGAGMHLPDALAFEREAAIEFARGVSAEDLGRRRDAVIERGRSQTGRDESGR
jgi:enoyl-CoA hydratase